MTVKEAISAIVTLATLPPQIDYTVPWQIKARKAQEFLNTLSVAQREKAERTIQRKINEYHDSGAAYYDSLF